MKYENIIKNHNKVSKQIVYRRLDKLGKTLFNNDWKLTENIGSAAIPVIANKQYRAEIGEMSLIHECSLDECNRAGYVLAVEHMFHEYRHIQQNTKEWNSTFNMESVKSVRQMTDIVRRNLVRNYYDSAYTHNYTKDPGEMDAETYDIQRAIKYFESDPIVTQKEAKEILYQFMMSEEYGHKEELDRYDIKSPDDMVKAFVDLRDTVVHKLYPITLEISPLIGMSLATERDMTEEFLTSYRYRTYREELKTCTDGRMMDKLLEQTIVMKYPDVIQSVPRLETELTNCKKLMESRIFTPEHYAVPVSKINYAGQSEEDEFTASVHKITDTIERENNANSNKL